MAIARTTGALFGTSESVLESINASTTEVGAEVDVLGDNASVAEAFFYVVVTASVIGTIEVKINPTRVTGQVYSKDAFEIKIDTINGTKKIPLGMRPVSRFMNAEVKNNNASSVTVSVLYELVKVS